MNLENHIYFFAYTLQEVTIILLNNVLCEKVSTMRIVSQSTKVAIKSLR